LKSSSSFSNLLKKKAFSRTLKKKIFKYFILSCNRKEKNFLSYNKSKLPMKKFKAIPYITLSSVKLSRLGRFSYRKFTKLIRLPNIYKYNLRRLVKVASI